jgi:hypothetical protein
MEDSIKVELIVFQAHPLHVRVHPRIVDHDGLLIHTSDDVKLKVGNFVWKYGTLADTNPDNPSLPIHPFPLGLFFAQSSIPIGGYGRREVFSVLSPGSPLVHIADGVALILTHPFAKPSGSNFQHTITIRHMRLLCGSGGMNFFANSTSDHRKEIRSQFATLASSNLTNNLRDFQGFLSDN